MVLRIEDVCLGGRVRDRATIIQRKTGRPVQFEITEATREAVQSWISNRGLRSGFLFPSRQHDSPHLSTRQYARIVDSWVKDSIAPHTAPIPCGGPKRRRSTARPLIFEPCSYCSVTQSSKALCAISVSRLMMPSASQSRSSFEESAPLAVRRRKACRVRHERLVGRCQIVTQRGKHLACSMRPLDIGHTSCSNEPSADTQLILMRFWFGSGPPGNCVSPPPTSSGPRSIPAKPSFSMSAAISPFAAVSSPE